MTKKAKKLILKITKMRKVAVFLVFLFLLFLIPSSVSAFNRGLVMGEATTSSQPVPLAAGSGTLLPDSPFYFLDLWRDRLRMLLTVNSEDRARLGMKIAAERLAELQLMLQRNNPRGVSLALENLTNHIDESRRILQSQQARGKEVGALAHDLNEAIDQDQEFLAKMEKHGPGESKFLIKAAQTKIAEAEVEIENELPQEEREDETLEELDQGIEEEIEEASASTQRIERMTREIDQRINKTPERD